jgi:hypothetical protein
MLQGQEGHLLNFALHEMARAIRTKPPYIFTSPLPCIRKTFHSIYLLKPKNTILFHRLLLDDAPMDRSLPFHNYLAFFDQSYITFDVQVAEHMELPIHGQAPRRQQISPRYIVKTKNEQQARR